MSTSQCNCGHHAVDNTGTYTIKASEDNTLERMVSNLRTLENSIDRLESVLDKLEAGNPVEPTLRQPTPLKETSVVNMWKSIPSILYDNSERVHKLIDRLEEIFR
jgi:hypothetical protein